MKKILRKIKNYFTERKTRKETKYALELMILNKFSDLVDLESQKLTAEKDAYEKLGEFGKDFDMSQFTNALADINKIANSPDLTTEYYKQVNENAHAEKETAKIFKVLK